MKILLVEDDRLVSDAVARALMGSGYLVDCVGDGSHAEVAAVTEPYDLVILDLGLPGMDGYEVAERLRAEGPCEKSLIIAISGYGQAKDRSRSKEAGFDYHLVKPVDHGQLISLMHQRSEA